jgi:acetyl esterase/lipase
MPRRVTSFGVAGLVVLIATSAACSSSRSTSSPAPEPLLPCGGKLTVRYAVHEGVDANLNSLDVWRPAAGADGCSARPLVVWVHGGGWTGGDKSDDIDSKVSLFTQAGDAFASINYRLTNDAVDPPTPQYPVHDQDAADGFSWLVLHAPELGVDVARIAVLGYSAGGGIVGAFTTDESYLGAHGVKLDSIRCAASIDGEGFDVPYGATHPNPNVHSTYTTAFGNDPATWEAASPINHIAPGKGIPTYFVAARGPEGRIHEHNEFIAGLRAAGVSVTVYDAQALDHATVATNIKPGDTTITPPLMDFIKRCFATEKP